MNVEHFMTPDPVVCETGDSIRRAAQRMRDKNVGFLVVLRGGDGNVAGIVTDRQLGVHALAEGLDPGTPVEKIMTGNPATVTLDDNLFTVLDTMRSAGVVRRVPVVNADKKLVGVVSISDVAVVARDLIDAVLLEAAHHALKEPHTLTGGKLVQKELRSPSQHTRSRSRDPAARNIRPVTKATKARSRKA